MNALIEKFDDPLKPLGLATGVFLVLAAAGTIIGAPWETQATMATAVIQVIGALLMAGLGAALAYLSWSDET